LTYPFFEGGEDGFVIVQISALIDVSIQDTRDDKFLPE